MAITHTTPLPAHHGPAIRTVTLDQTATWLVQGWRDMAAAPAASLGYGALITVLSYIVTYGLARAGLGYLILPAVAGFLLVGPVLAVGFYDISRRQEAGEPASLGHALSAWRANATETGVLGIILTLFLLAWFRVATLIYALFFGGAASSTTGLAFLDPLFAGDSQAATFLATGIIIGALFAATAFALSAVSMPLMLDRRVGAFAAMAVSVHAVSRNWKVMSGWAAMIAVITGLGLASFYLGLIVAFPLVGHASWHAYRALVGPET